MIWVEFLAGAAILVAAAIKLSEYGDALSVRTGLGGIFVGALLMAGATSLPELLSAINALNMGYPNLAAGNMFGSNMFNMALLGLMAVIFWQARVLRRVAMRHALTAALAMLMTVLVVFFVLADIDLRLLWVEADSLLLIAVYVGAVWLLRRSDIVATSERLSEEELAGVPPLWVAGIGFAGAAAILVLASPWLVRTSVELATSTGLGTGFVGTALLAIITSLPELVSTVAAARIGAYDMAVGNLFGSNVFNMFAVGLCDLFYVKGTFISEIDHTFALVGLLAVILTGLGLIGNLVRIRRRRWWANADALVMVAVYALGLWYLYARGLG